MAREKGDELGTRMWPTSEARFFEWGSWVVRGMSEMSISYTQAMQQPEWAALRGRPDSHLHRPGEDLESAN
jgi:hypothetical protein